MWSDFWRITGLEGMAPPAVLAVSGVLLLGAFAWSVSKRADPPGEAGTPRVAALALVGGIAGLGAAAAVLRDVDPAQLRYVAPALPAMLALVAVALGEAARLARRRVPAPAVALALAVLAAGTALFLVREARAAVESVLREPDPRGPLRAIAAQGYTVCHAGYDTAYTLQFLSDERVRFIPFHSPDRNRALSARLRSEPGPQCLVTDDGAVRRWLPSDAAQEGGPARRRAQSR